MPRHNFGGTATDQVVVKYRFGQQQLMAAAGVVTLTFWDAETGGNQYTDLLLNGSVVQKITTDADGYVPQFQGPDGVQTMWAADGDGTRHLMITTDGAIDLSSQLSTRIPTSEKGAVDGVATLDSAGALVQPVPAVTALEDKVASYREGEENLFAGEGSAAAGDPDATADGSGNGGYKITGLGPGALAANGRGWKNTAVGYGAMRNNVDGYRCTAVGNDALRENVGGLGAGTPGPSDPGSRNTAVGDLALVINTTGYANTAVGVDAAQTNDTGDHNTAVGYLAYSGIWNQTTQHRKVGHNNTAVGSGALHMTGTDGSPASNNTAVGADAIRNHVTGSNNTAIGYQANQNMDGLANTVAVGAGSETTANAAVAVGREAAVGSLRGVAVGDQAVVPSGFDSAVALGAQTTATRASQVHIGDRVLEIGALSGPGFPAAGSAEARLNVYDVGDGTLAMRVLWPNGTASTLATEV